MLGTDRTYLVRGLDDSVTTAYYKKMVKAATLLGARKSTAEKDLLDALEFEMTLANVTILYYTTLIFTFYDYIIILLCDYIIF